MEVKEILSKCDHTLLAQTATWKEIRAICDDGMKYGCASVCIPASYVKQAAEYVAGKLPICTVIGFPNGYDTTAAKCFMATDAVENGAEEVDMVINLGWVKDQKWDDLLAEIKARVDEMLDMVGLTEYRNYYPGQLSASMLQRVSIARAFAVQPELLLMDEPYGQLDNSLRYKLEDDLLRLWQHTGTTVIFITHNIEEAVYLSERILVLTNKPTGIKEEIVNDLPRPRDVTGIAFNKLRDKVTDLIKWW